MSEVSSAEQLFTALRALQDLRIYEINTGFDRLRSSLALALLAHAHGDLPRAKKHLNEALDAEHHLTGDCSVLESLAEAWGVDPETDR